jgi:hypothetical protein
MAQQLTVEIIKDRSGSGATSNPAETVMQIAGGWLLPRSLHLIADLGIADALDESPRSAADLAAETGAHPQALARTLRLLSGYGVFAMRAGMVSHTASSRLLRSDHPQSLRPLARMFGLPINLEAFRLFGHALRTGRPAIEQVQPNGIFAYLAERPDEARIFGEAMTAKAHAQVAGVLGAYDFSPFECIADIGGGRGHLLQAVLERAPRAKGVLFDLPHVIDDATGLISSERLLLQAGDFFRDRLPSCDAYMLMEVIHDWDDEKSEAILRALRAAAPDHATLLLLETIVPDEAGPHWAKTLDVLMLAITGGLQRTAQEYEALLARSGFQMKRVIDTPTGISIVEAVTH